MSAYMRFKNNRLTEKMETLFYNTARIVLSLLAGIGTSAVLYGQEGIEETRSSSISGQVLTYMFQYASGGRGLLGTYQVEPSLKNEVLLIADGDTLRAKLGKDGKFNFQGIFEKHVSVYFKEVTNSNSIPFFGSFELMPGENILLVPSSWYIPPGGLEMLRLFSHPFVTTEGDYWVYHYPTQKGTTTDDFYIMEKLKDWPGVEFNKRKGLLHISGDAVHCSASDGGFLFARKPDPSE